MQINDKYVEITESEEFPGSVWTLITGMRRIHRKCEEFTSSSGITRMPPPSPTHCYWSDIIPNIVFVLLTSNIPHCCDRAAKHCFTHTRETYIVTSLMLLLTARLIQNTHRHNYNHNILYVHTYINTMYTSTHIHIHTVYTHIHQNTYAHTQTQTHDKTHINTN